MCDADFVDAHDEIWVECWVDGVLFDAFVVVMVCDVDCAAGTEMEKIWLQ